MVVKLPKAVQNGIIQRNLRSNQVSTLPRGLSSLDSKYYSREEKEKDGLWSSYTRTLLWCSRCFSILPSRLSGNPMIMSLLTHRFPSVRTLPSMFVRCYSNFLAKPSCSLIVIFLRRPQVYLYLILPALASLLRLNPSRLWLLPSSTISSAPTSMRYDPTLLAAVAEAVARTVVVVQGEVQAVAVSFGNSNRFGPRLHRRPLRRALWHRSS